MRHLKIGQAIVHKEDFKPVKYAHKRGFFVEDLLMPQHRCFIFWDPLKPVVDVTTFYKLHLPDLNTLLMLRSIEITKTIKKFRGRGTEPAKQLFLIAPHGPKGLRVVMKFEELSKTVKACLNGLKTIGILSNVSQGDTTSFQKCINQSMSKGKVGTLLINATSPTERIQLLHPFYTPVLPTPLTIHYEPNEMLPMSYTMKPNCRSFIAAAFDKNGNLVEHTAKNIASYLAVGFHSILLLT